MKWAALLAAAMLILLSAVCSAQSNNNPVASRPSFQPFRYDEDWSSLADPALRTDWLDRLKYLSLFRPGWYFTLGGELRERYELLDQPGFGVGPKDTNGYFLQRYLLSSDFHFGSHFRFFSEMQSGLEAGRNGGPRPTDRDQLDVHQAFVDWRTGSTASTQVTVRVGRQELGFGSGRLISPAEGLNIRRALDGARVIVKTKSMTFNVTALRLVRSAPGIFDDVPDHTQTYWGAGLVAPHPFWKSANLSLHYHGLDRKNARFQKGTGRAVRHTIGVRNWKTSPDWDFNYEGLFQWGSFAGAPIRAWALSEDTGYTVRSEHWQPRFGLRADIASGDGGSTSRALGSFDPLFPAAPVYSGPSGVLGPTNLIDVTPNVRLQFTKNVALAVELASFWRQSLQDGIYTPFITPLRIGKPGAGRYVAMAPSVTAGWQQNRHVLWSAIYTRLAAGEFLRRTPPASSMNYVAAWVSFRF